MLIENVNNVYGIMFNKKKKEKYKKKYCKIFLKIILILF